MKILDLCCGAGGASVGYSWAFPGAEFTGVDVWTQPGYPFEFVRADARTFDVSGFDLVHVSPPCQGYTTMRNANVGPFRRQDIDVYRDLVKQCPAYVIENVSGAAKHMRNPICLHGGSFGLGVDRPRLFEASFVIPEPPYTPVQGPKVYGSHGDLKAASEAMGIDWMDWHELKEAIPPAYTHYIGKSFLDQQVYERSCLWCGNQIPENVTRPWRYCSNAHRQRAYRHRIAAKPAV